MNMITRKIGDEEFNFATTLRVAYKIQGYNNHTSYTKIFREITEATVEKQVEILYAAFQIAEPVKSLSYKQQDFLAFVLDNCSTRELMSVLTDILMGITGATEADIDDEDDEDEDETSDDGEIKN